MSTEIFFIIALILKTSFTRFLLKINLRIALHKETIILEKNMLAIANYTLVEKISDSTRTQI